MSSDSHEKYVHRVQEETKRYTHDLLAENQRLQLIAERLEKECRLLEEEVARRRAERLQLLEQLRTFEDQSRTFAEQYTEVEQQNANLANLYVASYRLHSTLDKSEVLAAIQEIIINLIGSEEIAIFERAEGSDMLSLVASVGVDEAEYSAVRLGRGVIGSAAATGEIYIRTNGAAAVQENTGLTACIPLVLQGRVLGVVAVFRLLQQKSGVEAIDRELFDLLGTHAAVALYCTTLHAQIAGAALAS
ncbi:MAG TPA: GAF domain-containing protein [Thermoanaerobaculia bacterium]|nr:GAF domain-containing protein [Thermoanaerobaculia bacterium]